MTYTKDNISFHPIPTNPRFKNLTGQRFTRLVVIGYKGKIDRVTWWWTQCDCGTVKAVRSYSLINQDTRSCGCLQVEEAATRQTTHGMTSTPEYESYCHAKGRCNNPNNPDYALYGGRGIEFRFDSFHQFFQEVGHRPTRDHSIERIDTNGHYETENVKWATPYEQSNNRRCNHRITFQGKTLNRAEWERELGLPSHTLTNRYRLGWSDEKALTTPVRVQIKRRSAST